jgi:hypothetical protein
VRGLLGDRTHGEYWTRNFVTEYLKLSEMQVKAIVHSHWRCDILQHRLVYFFAAANLVDLDDSLVVTSSPTRFRGKAFFASFTR